MYIPITTMSLLALCSPLVAAEQKLRGVLLSGGTTEDGQQEQVLVEEELLHRDPICNRMFSEVLFCHYL